MPGARKLIIAQMARAQSPANVYPRMHASSPMKSRFRSKDCTLTLLAGLLVLTGFFFFYARDGRGLGAADAALHNEPFKLPPSVDPSVAKPSSAPIAGHDGSALASSTLSTTDALAHPAQQPATSTTTATALAPDGPRAVIIESAMIPNLVPLTLHFATVLGPAWGLVLFTLADGWVEPRSPAFQRHLASGHIEVRFLPPATALTSSQAVSRFLTAPWLWEQLAGARRVLLFQSDSVLCAKSEAAVDDYFEYDYVGAPIAPMYGQGYNGGLSLRNPAAFLNVTREVDFAASGHEFEDQFFYQELKRRGAAMPAVEVAKTFAVETIYYETPLGYHQPQRWQAQRMGEIEQWCPEVKMLIGRRAS